MPCLIIVAYLRDNKGHRPIKTQTCSVAATTFRGAISQGRVAILGLEFWRPERQKDLHLEVHACSYRDQECGSWRAWFCVYMASWVLSEWLPPSLCVNRRTSPARPGAKQPEEARGTLETLSRAAGNAEKPKCEELQRQTMLLL